MAARKSLLATLSSIAISSAGAAGALATGATGALASGPEFMDPPVATEAAFLGLVTQLADSCLVERPQGYEVVVGDVRVAQCCAVIRQVGPENADFLQAVALADPQDPRLLVLNQDLVTVLLSCQQEAIDRLAELALNTQPAAGPGAQTLLYTG